MDTTQIPPDGVPAKFLFEVPRPGELETIGGVRVHFVFNIPSPAIFSPVIRIDGEEHLLSEYAMGPTSITRVLRLQSPLPAPAQIELVVNETTSLAPDTVISIYAWGAQTESGEGALNPDEGGRPSTLTDVIEVGMVEVVTWRQWNLMTEAEGWEGGS